MTSAIYQNGWSFHDDISIIVVEVSPQDGQEFYYTAKKKMKSSSLRKKLIKAIKRKVLPKSHVQPKIVLGHLEVLDDVDGLDVDLTPLDKITPVVDQNLDQIDSASEMEGFIFTCDQDKTADCEEKEHWEDCVSQFVS